jgi:hypothetical protein
MLSSTDLLTITTKPQVKDIDLQTILSFYEQHLCQHRFIYELDDPDHPSVQIRFEPKQLCHMLGIHYILKGKQFSGQSGFDLIKKGTLSLEYLRKTNKVWFVSQKNRILYFPFVYQLLKTPTVLNFSTNSTGTMINAELILYNQQGNAYLHLGVCKYPDTDHHYYPLSFYERNNRDHIDGQTEVTVKKIKVESL